MRSRNWGRQKSIRRAVRFLAQSQRPGRQVLHVQHPPKPSPALRIQQRRPAGVAPVAPPQASGRQPVATRPEPSPVLRIQRRRFPSLRRAAGRSHCGTCGPSDAGWRRWLPGLKLHHAAVRFLLPWLACPACLLPPPEAGPVLGMDSPNPAGVNQHTKRDERKDGDRQLSSSKLSSDSQPQPCRQEGGRTGQQWLPSSAPHHRQSARRDHPQDQAGPPRPLGQFRRATAGAL